VAPREPAVRARSDADIVLILPIDQVVTACGARPRVVGDLVGRQSRFGEPRLRVLEHLGGLFLGRKGEGAARMIGEETCAALDGELIERQMLARERQRTLQLVGPGLWRLAGPRVDQVERIACEVPARGAECAKRLVDRMLP